MRILRDKTLVLLCMICIVTACSGCSFSSLSKQESSPPIEQPEELGQLANVGRMDYLAAINLVNTIVQVPRLHPGALAVVQMHKPDRRFGRYVSQVMKAAGYNIQYVDRKDSDASYLTYSRALGPVMSSYKIGIGEVKIRRSFTVEEDLVMPASSIFVFGADPDVIEIDDSIFDRHGASPEYVGLKAVDTSF